MDSVDCCCGFADEILKALRVRLVGLLALVAALFMLVGGVTAGRRVADDGADGVAAFRSALAEGPPVNGLRTVPDVGVAAFRVVLLAEADKLDVVVDDLVVAGFTADPFAGGDAYRTLELLGTVVGFGIASGVGDVWRTADGCGICDVEESTGVDGSIILKIEYKIDLCTGIMSNTQHRCH